MRAYGRRVAKLWHLGREGKGLIEGKEKYEVGIRRIVLPQRGKFMTHLSLVGICLCLYPLTPPGFSEILPLFVWPLEIELGPCG